MADTQPNNTPDMPDLESAETATVVKQAVEKLPEKQREVLVMRTWGGLPYAEIAQALGRAEATVRSQMHQALASLRKHLEPRVEDLT